MSKVFAVLSLAVAADAQFQPYAVNQPNFGYAVNRPYSVPQPIYQPFQPQFQPQFQNQGQYCAQPGQVNRCGQSNRQGGINPQTTAYQPYGVQQTYGSPQAPSVYGNNYGNNWQGTQAYGVPQPYGLNQAYGQPFGAQPYGISQPYGVSQPYGMAQPYGFPQPNYNGRRLAQFNGGLLGSTGFQGGQAFAPFQQQFSAPYQQQFQPAFQPQFQPQAFAPQQFNNGIGCQCDTICMQYGDCCPDYVYACQNGYGSTPKPTAVTNAPTATPVAVCTGVTSPICNNRGVCNIVAGVNTCTGCTGGFTGTTCQTPPPVVVPQCVAPLVGSVQCSGNGNCVNGAAGISCTCNNGFTGATCATAPPAPPAGANPCTGQGIPAALCNNRGVCTNGGVNGALLCTNCQGGFTGNACQTPPVNQCTTQCANGCRVCNVIGCNSAVDQAAFAAQAFPNACCGSLPADPVQKASTC